MWRSASHLRIALILLDNCAELQLHHWASIQLTHDAMMRRAIESARGWNAPEHLIKPLGEDKLLPTAQERRVLRIFDDLLRYASETKGVLDSGLSEALGYLHRYRNEAHHRGELRESTLRTVVLILFEINCRLLASVKPGMTIYGSNADYSWLQERFGLASREVWNAREHLPRMIADIRSELPTGADDVAATLADNLSSRLDGFLSDLDFVTDNLKTTPARNEVLKMALSRFQTRSDDALLRERTPPGIGSTMDLSLVEEVRVIANDVRFERDPLQAFRLFGRAERQLEPAEFVTHELAVEIDSAIQFPSELARGK